MTDQLKTAMAALKELRAKVNTCADLLSNAMDTVNIANKRVDDNKKSTHHKVVDFVGKILFDKGGKRDAAQAALKEEFTKAKGSVDMLAGAFKRLEPLVIPSSEFVDNTKNASTAPPTPPPAGLAQLTHPDTRL